jgi:hypothetical protein
MAMPAIEYLIATRCSDLTSPSIMHAPSFFYSKTEEKVQNTA